MYRRAHVNMYWFSFLGSMRANILSDFCIPDLLCFEYMDVNYRF